MNSQFETVIGCKYDWVKPFQDNFALVYRDGLWGVIDLSGRELIKPQYKSLSHAMNNKFIAQQDSMFGLINTEGQVILPFEYHQMSYLFNNLYAVLGNTNLSIPIDDYNPYAADNLNLAWGAVNDKGEMVLPKAFIGIKAVNDSSAIACKFVHSNSLHTGIPRYYLLGSYQYIRSDGSLMDSIYSFSKLIEGGGDWFEGSYLFNAEAYCPIVVNGPSVSITQSKDSVVNYYYSEELPNGYSIVWKEGPNSHRSEFHSWFGQESVHRSIKFGLINQQGDFIIPPIYDALDYEGRPWLIASSDGNYGLVGIDGEFIIPLRYNWMETDGSLIMLRQKLAEYEYQTAVFNEAGEMIIPFKKVKAGTNGPFGFVHGSIYSREHHKYIDKVTGNLYLAN